MRKNSLLNRKRLLAWQDRRFKRLLRFVWEKSEFYRAYYGGHGVNEESLHETRITDLPFTSKELLMENFDAAVTDKGLKKASVMEWIEKHKDPHQLYQNEFMIVNTSGTSGSIGIFVYDRAAWNTIRAAAGVRISRPVFSWLRANRVAFYGATQGRFGGISLASSSPGWPYDVRLFSLLEPIADIVHRMNAFQPHQISGYASAIAMLAEHSLSGGGLRISPRRVIVSGDPLTPAREQTILRAWGVAPLNYYATSEALCIAAKLKGDTQMRVFDDLHIIELLDGHMEEVAAREEGQIVLTSLYNYTLPLIRYQLRDVAVKGTPEGKHGFSTIQQIIGRVNESLPIVLDQGERDFLHPIMLNGFFVPGLEKIQFISQRADKIEIKYTAERDLDDLIRAEFDRLLVTKGASKSVSIQVQRVDELMNNPQTGKFELVILKKS